MVNIRTKVWHQPQIVMVPSESRDQGLASIVERGDKGDPVPTVFIAMVRRFAHKIGNQIVVHVIAAAHPIVEIDPSAWTVQRYVVVELCLCCQ